jgi:hypothetical protein
MSFSPSAFHASLQTSTVHASNQAIGVAMSLIKKSDVKNHLSMRHKNRIHVGPGSEVDATGISRSSQAIVEGQRSGFPKDFTADHKRTPAIVVPIRDAFDENQTQPSPTF